MSLRILTISTILITLIGCSGQHVAPQATAQSAPATAQPATGNATQEAQPVAMTQPTAGQSSAPQPAAGPASVYETVSTAHAPAQGPAEPAAPEYATEPEPAAPPAREARPLHERETAAQVLIPAGTRIRVRLDQTLNTKYTHAGTGFGATLEEPIVVGDRVIVPRGTAFSGAVIASKTSGRFRGRGYMEVTLRSFRLHGLTYRVDTSADTRATGSHKKRNLALMGGGSAAGAGIGAIAGGGPGALIGAGAGAAAGATTEFFTGKKSVRLPAETELVFRLREPITIRRT